MLFYLFITIKMIVDNFVNRLDENRGFSKNTVANYKRTIILFDNYLKSISLGEWGVEQCERIRLMDVNLFIQSQKNKKKDTRTCNNYLACIKNFLRFCLIMGYNVEDYRKILYAREVKKKIDCLNDDECTKLMKYFRKIKCKNHKEELIKTRNLCIVQLLLYTGLRVSELCNIKVSEVKKELQIIGKGGKRRVVFLYPEDLKLIDLYLFLRHDDHEYLFISHSTNYEGKKLSRVTVEEIIREGAKNAGLEGKVFPHKLRHTFATNLLKAKVDLPHIQNLLGHSNLTTTQNYLSIFNTDLERAQRRVKRY